MLLLCAAVCALLTAGGAAGGARDEAVPVTGPVNDQGQDCVIGVIGNSTVLPCVYKGDETLEPQTVSVEWRSDDGLVVHAFVQGRDALENQDPSYRGRTELFTARLPEGNFSLRLSDVIEKDPGKYVCYFHKEDMESTKQLDQVCLAAAARYSETELQGVRDPDGDYADFSCSSSGGFPEPRVHWLINLQPPPVDTVMTLVSQDPITGLYTVFSLLTVHSTQDIAVSCTIENLQLNESKTSTLINYHTRSGFKVGIVVAVAVAVAVAVIVLLKRRSLCRVWGRHLQYSQSGARDEGVPLTGSDNNQAQEEGKDLDKLN
ncbi:ICOS ligand isoform X2 [Amia ocellicauda]|uniref:ICOS ligand isoform X2 n=1 Tax=Amia ocellicauda TaxID=2972642 RepID=UPI0034648114